ncbi:SIR2 family protein [Solimonas flava]|uniref:SIR2 family protein n=1 Tax=Solimonas flava TaxID=415849 RepID=UPI00040F4A92|nr:SIR2 family protein [Solimonas flava]
MSAPTSTNGGDEDELLRVAVRQALNSDAVLFLGAGAAKDARTKDGNSLPTGAELSNALASECGLGSGYSLDSIAQHFLEVRSETALINALRRHLNVASVGDVLIELAKVPWSRVWTTNYDDAFERALTLGKMTHYSLTTAAGVENAQGNRLILLHINGALARLTQALTPDFVLTALGYSTQTFMDTEWSTVFRNDLQRAKAIVFVGYSLADIDISRLVFNPDLFRAKVHFVDRVGVDPVLRTKLSKFGTVHSIGLEALRNIVAEERAQWVPPRLIEEYRCWFPIEPKKPLRTATDDDFYELILRGVSHDELIMSQLEEPTKATYTVVRDFEAACISHLGQQNAVATVVGSFANGKTVALRSIALQLAAQGRDVFEFGAPMEVASLELQRLCKRDSAFVLVLENYSRNLELVECFCRYARPDCALLLSERTEVHELRSAVLNDRAKSRNVKVYEVDLLENNEVARLSALLNLRGLWGERAGLSEAQRLAYLKQDCGRQLQAVLIDVANSPQIRTRLADIVRHFTSLEGGLSVLITLCLLQAIGEQPRTDVAAELLQLSYDSFQRLTRDEVARQILAVQSGVAAFRSPVMASAVLNGLPTATSVTEVVAECVKRGEQSRRADSYLGTISKELMRFANLERILPDKGRRVALQNFYEDIKTVPSIRSNPHYWLQYAMARMSLGELSVARKYFEQSYSLAEKMRGYDTFQIDNHYCRLLLREAENTTDSDEAFKAVDEALQTLKKQVLRENRHYPYRSAWNLEGVAKRHGKSWTESQRQSVASAARYLIDAAKRLDDHVARSVAVVGGLQRLNNVIAELS